MNTNDTNTGGTSGALKASRPVTVLSAALMALLVASGATYLHVSSWQAHSKSWLEKTTEESILTQRIAKQSLEAARGSASAFAQLTESRDRFDRLYREMDKGDAASALPPSPEATRAALREVQNAWLHLREKADTIIGARDAVVSVGGFVALVNEIAPKLQEDTTKVANLMLKGGAPTEVVHLATRQTMLAERMQASINRALSGGRDAALAIDQFGRDAEEFGKSLMTLLESGGKADSAQIRKTLAETATLFGAISDQTKNILNTSAAVLPALEASGELSGVADRLSDSVASLATLYATTPGLASLGGVVAGPGLMVTLALAALGALVALGRRFIDEARQREQESADTNARNQNAIMRLLDEMGDLANGDLTVKCTVTDDVTGAIADSTNYAIEALRVLVTTINETSRRVSEAAQETQSTAEYLSVASERQGSQIAEATGSVAGMAEAIGEMTQTLGESAEVARHSVEVAAKGASVVRSTIDGMNQIREHIQETSKRIKRLGESSQQIGEIVELIDDIADQTNILALNAAMQAAMAGEAGRGFAVVADEVQRLAERAGQATRQIDTLVRTIQADTQEAIASMERSTSGVVHGAELAEHAGQALAEIDQVSQRISELTRSVTALASEQARTAQAVNGTMGQILSITGETTQGTRRTAHSTGTLATLATELQQSVSGFKLPA